MSKLKLYLLRWILKDAVFERDLKRVFTIVFEEAQATYYEDNQPTLLSYVTEQYDAAAAAAQAYVNA
jgi:hypothetical protein